MMAFFLSRAEFGRIADLRGPNPPDRAGASKIGDAGARHGISFGPAMHDAQSRHPIERYPKTLPTHRAEVAVSAPQLATPVPPPPPLPPQQLATATMSAPTPAPPPLPTQRAQSAPSDGAERLREENEQLRRENARYRAENEELRQRLTSMEVEVRSLRLEHRRDEAEAARAPAPP